MSEIKNVFHDKIIEMGKQTDDYGQFELYCQKIQKKGIEYMQTDEYKEEHHQAFYDSLKDESV
jgi:hypothetical protein